ncbi:hypothetical protein CYMTET_12451 [Cymbomonas tetramitiformis]|uniref:Uncharacterized protein n=1 Tax=Cymbomonas tetramitiformis TaxID=36881 RepID=A0AAE0GKI4_9CHLO|nr:hypothetical protein CYMTET_12451 [Cymbomonas tetramitiformis]
MTVVGRLRDAFKRNLSIRRKDKNAQGDSPKKSRPSWFTGLKINFSANAKSFKRTLTKTFTFQKQRVSDVKVAGKAKKSHVERKLARESKFRKYNRMVAEEFMSIMGWNGGVAAARRRKELDEQGCPPEDDGPDVVVPVTSAVEELNSAAESEAPIERHTHVKETRGSLTVEEDTKVPSMDAEFPMMSTDIDVEDLERERMIPMPAQVPQEDMPVSQHPGAGQQRAESKEKVFVPALAHAEQEVKLDVQDTREAIPVRRSVHGWGQNTTDVHAQKHSATLHPAHGREQEEARGVEDTIGNDVHVLEYSAEAKVDHVEEHRHQHGDVVNTKDAAARQQHHRTHKDNTRTATMQPPPLHAVENNDAQTWMAPSRQSRDAPTHQLRDSVWKPGGGRDLGQFSKYEHVSDGPALGADDASHTHKNTASASRPNLQAGQARDHKQQAHHHDTRPKQLDQREHHHKTHTTKFDESHLPHFTAERSQRAYRAADDPHLEGQLIVLDASESAMYEIEDAADGPIERPVTHVQDHHQPAPSPSRQKDPSGNKHEARKVVKFDHGDDYSNSHTQVQGKQSHFNVQVRGQAVLGEALMASPCPKGETQQVHHRNVKPVRKAGNKGPRPHPSSGWEGEGSFNVRGQSVVRIEERSPQQNGKPKGNRDHGMKFAEYVEQKQQQ